jgi:hypothetical protein
MGSGPAFDANDVCPLFFSEPLLAYTRDRRPRAMVNDGTESRINRSGEPWGNG